MATTPARSDRGVKPAALNELSALLGDRLATSESVRSLHGRDESPLASAPPDMVAFVSSTEEVAGVLSICNRHVVPVIPFGAGTSLEGHVLAPQGGVSLDLSGIDAPIEVRVEDMDVTVGAGVTRKRLNERLKRDGLFFPVDPGADATLGGMAATGASGTTTVRYGAMRENVLSLKVVMADGRVIDTATRARKSAAGYDLTRLIIGSEGTLGVITEVTLRVYGLPEVMSAAVCTFASIGDAVEAVTSVLQLGVPVARIEFLDAEGVAALNSYSDLDHPVAPLLLLEFHGNESEVLAQSATVEGIVSGFGATGYQSAIEPAARTALWRARHEHFFASLALRPGAKAITTDVCVPISKLPTCVTETRADLDASPLTATMVGHVGDGNFHVVILVDPDDEEEMEEAEKLNGRMVARAQALGGTCTGEHGIGLRKKAFLLDETPGGVEVMRAIKRSLDPNGIMNPGKVFDA